MNIRIAMVSMLFPLLASATVYEGDEHWSIYDNKPAGATIERVYDESKKSDVVELKGEGKRNAYIIGSRKGNKAWKNQNEKSIKWEMNFKEKFKISIFIETEQGERTLLYYSHPEDRGLLKEKYIRFGLGNRTIQGNWVTIERNLEKDLKKFNPDNHLIAVNGFKVQGSGKIGKIELLEEENVSEELKNVRYLVANSVSSWKIIQVTPSGKRTPEGATAVVYSVKEKNTLAIQLKGKGRKNSYLIGGKTENDVGMWHEYERPVFSWDMKCSEKYRITIYTKTKNGYRSFYITHKDGDGGLKKNKYIYLGMGARSKSGTWQTFTIDLEKEIKKYEPENELIAVYGMKVQGSMDITNMFFSGKKKKKISPVKFLDKDEGKKELFKLALSDKKEPEKGVEVFKQNNIAYIFVSAMSRNYARYFMGLTKVDISDPKNIKDLGYDDNILKSYLHNEVLAKGFVSSHEQDILLDFIPVEDEKFNIIVTKRIDDDDPEFQTDALIDAIKEGLPFYTESLKDVREGDDYMLRDYRIYLIPLDDKKLKKILSYTEDEYCAGGETVSYNSTFRLLTVFGWGCEEGWYTDLFHISKNLKNITYLPRISPYNSDNLTERKVSFLDDYRIVVTNHDDDEPIDRVDTYDGTKLPELVKIENREN